MEAEELRSGSDHVARRDDRSCGDCTLCCKLLYVRELDKPAQQMCEHVCESGCSIYTNRPYSCRRFECLWLKGYVPEWARPDNIGVVFDTAKPRIVGKVMPLVVIEEFTGAHKQPLVRPIIENLGQGREVIVVDQNNNLRPYAPEAAQ